MIAYFIDEPALSKKQIKQLDKVDLLTTQRGISGRKYRLAPLHDLRKSAEEAIASGANILVAVGGDAIVNRLINAVFSIRDQDTGPVGIKVATIPMGDSVGIARSFGVGDVEASVGAIASGVAQTIDLGRVNKRHYFIRAAIFPAGVSLDFASYKISSTRKEHHISVCNGPFYTDTTKKRCFNCTDGLLDAVVAYRPMKRIKPSKDNPESYVIESVFPVRSIQISSREKSIGIYADIEKRMSVPIFVEAIPGALDFISNVHMPHE